MDGGWSDCGTGGGRCKNALTQWTVPFEMMLTFALVTFSRDAVECLYAFERRSDAPTRYSPGSSSSSSSSSTSSSFFCFLFDLALALYLAMTGVAAGRLFGSGGED